MSKRIALSVAVCATTVLFSSLLAQQKPAAKPVDVVVDSSAPAIATFDGLGAEVDPYELEPSPDRWQIIRKRMEYARFGLIRVMISGSSYCKGFNEKGEPQYIWEHPDPEAKSFPRLLEVLDFAQEHGISVYLGEWVHPKKLGIQSPDDPRWARMIGGLMDYLVRQKHYTVIKYFIEFNEPNGTWMWHEVEPNFAQWSGGIRNLRKELDARGLTQIGLAGPDTSDGEPWFEDSVHKMASLYGAWECHSYEKDPVILDGTVGRQLDEARRLILKADPDAASKPRILGEVGLATGKVKDTGMQSLIATFPYGVEMADLVAQVANAGWTGASAWELDDSLHKNKFGQPNTWGFWFSASSSDMAPRPWFYTWSLASRYLPKGASILRVQTGGDVKEFRATAAQWTNANGKQGTVLLVNEEDAPRTVTLHAPMLMGKSVSVYVYYDTDRPVDADQLPKPSRMATLPADPKRAVTFTMPSRGVLLLTTDH